MIKRILLCLITVVIALSSFAQSLADINSPKILPPSPDAAALGKYGQIPVDKSTGIPDISIPLYEIKTPRFSLPISLAYHASGIKLDEAASWVGIGWSLNSGGVITRSIAGIADEKTGIGFLTDVNALKTASSIQFPRDSTYLENLNQNLEDSQPDNFFYNFAGHSGAFIYGYNPRVPILIPYKPLQITFNPGTGVGYFVIVDESGNSYLFNNPELGTSPISQQLTGISSWYLTQMVSADKSDTIKFSYTSPGAYTFNDYAVSFSQNLGPYGGGQALWPIVTTINQSHNQQIHLTGITFKGGKLDFIGKGGRKDNSDMSLDSIIVSNYDYTQKKYTRLKSFKFQTDYFKSNIGSLTGADTVRNYRLKLVGVTENDQNSAAVKAHQFDYNTTMLPPVHNYGQDKWGYYNGAYNNQTLLELQNLTSNYSYDNSGSHYNSTPVSYTVGGTQGANRSVSASNMQAGILQKITYPTKGYTMFTYEPNQYLTPTTTTVTTQAYAIGVYKDTSVAYFTPTTAMFNSNSSGTVSFHIHIKSTNNVYNNSDSYIKLIQVSNGAVLYTTYAQSNGDVDMYYTPTLTAGTQYQLMAVAIGGTQQTDPTTLPQASISTTYQVTGPPVATNVGGLRIKTIKNYDSNGSALSTETYKYGLNESGTGDFLSQAFLMTNHSSHLFQILLPQPNSFPNVQAVEDTYSNSSVYPLSSLGGSPVAYEQVTVYHGDTVQNIGKSIYNYTITPDSLLIVSSPTALIPGAFQGGPFVREQNLKPIPRIWQDGEPVHEAHYKYSGGTYSLVQEKLTNYHLFFRTAGRGMYCAYALEFSGAPRSYYNMYTNINDFNFYDYPISVGSRVPSQTITINYATDGITKLTQDTTRYYYDNLAHVFPTRIVNYDGKGDSLLNQAKYPQDMVNAGLDPTGIYASMTSANIINPTIEFTEFKNGLQMKKSRTNYSIFNTSYIEPQSVELQTLANASEVRLQYLGYDNGNLKAVGKANGPKTSYQWGYNKVYPVAQVINAPSNDIFYDSFEEGDGNSQSGDARTGHYSYSGTYSKALNGLDAGTYTLSYWSKNGGVWTWNVLNNISVTGSTYAVNLSGQIDDVRFYPSNAQMTSYTYDPLVGMTSSTDAKGAITYYEYDGFQRLMNIKNKDGNIIKHMDYHYQGQ